MLRDLAVAPLTRSRVLQRARDGPALVGIGAAQAVASIGAVAEQLRVQLRALANVGFEGIDASFHCAMFANCVCGAGLELLGLGDGRLARRSRRQVQAAADKTNAPGSQLAKLGFADFRASPKNAQEIARQMRKIEQPLMHLGPARFRDAKGYKNSDRPS
jgi:hypothetical protein